MILSLPNARVDASSSGEAQVYYHPPFLCVLFWPGHHGVDLRPGQKWGDWKGPREGVYPHLVADVDAEVCYMVFTFFMNGGSRDRWFVCSVVYWPAKLEMIHHLCIVVSLQQRPPIGYVETGLDGDPCSFVIGQ